MEGLQSMYGTEGGILSKFNEGAFQMLRLHLLQDTINNVSVNPLEFNENKGKYNYEILLSCIIQQYAEASTKCTPKEKLPVEVMRLEINNIILYSPPIIIREDRTTHLPTKYYSEKNWLNLRSRMFTYQLKVRDLLEKHKLTSPAEDDDDGL